MGGDTEYEGLLEVCFNQRWGTVNGDGWSSVDTQVVCQQLGYYTTGIYNHGYTIIFIIIEAPQHHHSLGQDHYILIR